MKRIKNYNNFILEIAATPPPPPPPIEIHSTYEKPADKFSAEDTYVYQTKKVDDEYSFFKEYSYDQLETLYKDQNSLDYFTKNGFKIAKGQVKDISYCERLAEQDASKKCNGSYEVLAAKKFENSDTGEYVYFMLIKSK